MASVLEYTAIIKLELPGEHENVSITAPGNTLCPILGQGFDLGFLTTEGLSLVNFVPLLTNILRISNDRFLVPNQGVPAHLNMSQLTQVLSHLDIQLSITENSPPQLFLRKEDSGKLHLQSFSPQGHSRCRLGGVVRNIFHSLQNTLQILHRIYEEVKNIINFFGSNHLLSDLSNCMQVPEITLQNVMGVDDDNLEYCIAKMDNGTSSRLVKRSSMLSWLFGSGQQLDAIEHSLMDSINHFTNLVPTTTMWLEYAHKNLLLWPEAITVCCGLRPSQFVVV